MSATLAIIMELERENARLLQLLTDEQNAHKLTTETLTKAIRDGDKAEQYRVERDKARQAFARYARHDAGCSFATVRRRAGFGRHEVFAGTTECSCGYRAALDGVSP